MKVGDLRKFKTAAERLKLVKTCQYPSCNTVVDCNYDMIGDAPYPIGIPRIHRRGVGTRIS
jgi:hypothetical protein